MEKIGVNVKREYPQKNAAVTFVIIDNKPFKVPTD